jgi:uncharacterized protein (TIGR00730 family)
MKKNICVFCGSRPGANPDWSIWSQGLGAHIAKTNHQLIFGGGASGLMGELARSCIDAGGGVIGIIPDKLKDTEGLVENLQEVHYVNNMSERKQLMSDLADAFVIIPGGIGTLDELFDVWTNAQVGFNQKPIVIANWSGYYNELFGFLNHCAAQGFMTTKHFEKITIVQSPEELHSWINDFS